MGNTDSNSSFIFPGSSSSSSPSAHSWWRSSSHQDGNRSRGRSYLPQRAARQPFTSSRYEHAPKSTRGGSRPRAPGDRRSPTVRNRGCGERAPALPDSGPKVLFGKDGSVRVEFTNTRVVPTEPQGMTTMTGAAPGPEPSCTSKGGSLSSDGSWYDLPWGNCSELSHGVFGQSADNNSGYTTCSSTRDYSVLFSARVEDVSPGFSPATGGYSSCSPGRTEDSGVGDSLILQPDLTDSVYSSCSTLAAFPTAPETSSISSSSLALLDDVIQEEECLVVGVEQCYSSCTLPCRKAEPGSTAVNATSRTHFLKRIRRLSDWTGSLSRKKRRVQEPHGEVFISGQSSSCNSLWSSNPLNTINHSLTAHCGSAPQSLNQKQNSDAQRLNIYENFKKELETGGGGSQTESSDGEEDEEREEEEEEEEMDGEVEVGGAQQLDLLVEEEEPGVVRRAGWLAFKALIATNKDRKLELVARRKWRRYWVTLRGCTLLLYDTYGRSGGSEKELSPHYTLLVDDNIVQAVPEHPRKEHVFCLSNSHGDVYLFQASNQTDLENWVTALHSASAALLAKRHGVEDTLRLLRSRSRSLLRSIDMDGKMKKMAELQLTVIKEQKNRKAVESQIQQWEQNLEKLNLDLFRLKCYLSSLQGGELPNPKSLLAVASRPSKSMLGRLGVFSVSSFHALVCSREEARWRRHCLSGGSRRRGLSYSLKALDGLKRHSGDGRQSTARMCDRQQLSALGVFTLNICRDDADFGFAVTGHVDGAGRSHVFVSEVDPQGRSARDGLRAGDEVLEVNGVTVSGLDLDLMQSLFRHQDLQLLLKRDETPDQEEPAAVAWPDPVAPPDTTDPCCLLPVPQNLHAWNTDSSSLIFVPTAVPPPVPPPCVCDNVWTPSADAESPPQNMERLQSLYQTFPECRAADADVPKNPYGGEVRVQAASLSVCQRLRKVIQELVDTERSYVKDLVRLFDLYLTPLQTEAFLSNDEMEALFGSLPEMLDFQKVFLRTLEERVSAGPNLSVLETPEQFQNLLISLGGSFLYYADHFKLYSGFCTNHVKVQKVLERAKTDAAFKHFLETRNPTNQHSSSLESYLIKPVQRVLKYPLLLRELVSLTHPESPEHTHLTEALRAMETVASHINEVQKIYEDYGCVFDQLAAEQSGTHRQVPEMWMGEFLVRSSALWLNPPPSLGRLRKDPELALFVFRQAVVLVYRQNCKLKKRLPASRSADLDPFRFRWMIPVSAVQVRPTYGAGAEDPCVWELVHSRSEAEGRPETVFQLCSSGVETKAGVLQALRLLLRDQASSSSLRKTRLSPMEKRRQQRTTQSCRPVDGVLGDTCSEPLLPSQAHTTGARGKRSRLCSLTSDLEAQLQRLNFTEEDQTERGATKRQSSGLHRSPGREEPLDLGSLLERDFSVQSMTSMINEDCFFDGVLGPQQANANMLTQS